ncbi:MAG: HAMP domain-containing protein [Actinomycetales bacterium]|nr:HAMP domain-containing protein [Actinomycetales bacterium]
MTLRWRITAVTVLLVALAAGVVAGFAYTTAKRIQYQTLDAGLLAASGQVSPRALERGGSRLPLSTYQPYAIALLRPQDETATMLLPAGNADQPLALPTITREQAQARSGTISMLPGEPTYRAIIRPSGPRRALLIVAAPVAEIEAGLRQLALGLALAVALTAAIGGLGAWFIVRRFFRPVDAMVQAASDIAAGDMDLRVPQASAGTELGELSQALNGMIESLTTSLTAVADSERRLRTFVSDASHEIRTPLTAIRGYIDLLQVERTNPSELERRALDRLTSESRRLEGLVTQLLLLDRIDEQDEEWSEFDLEPLVREYCSDLALTDTRPLTLDLAPTLIRGNESQWRQVLANLVQNIQRHTPAQSQVNVHLHHQRDAQGAPLAVLEIDDAGPGIPPERRAFATQRFTRLDPSRSKQTGGFGLGMSIITAVVQRHGGSIELVDSPLGGLRVRIQVGTKASHLN